MMADEIDGNRGAPIEGSVSVAEAAKILGVSQRTVQRAIAHKKLPDEWSDEDRRRRAIPRQALAQYIAEREQEDDAKRRAAIVGQEVARVALVMASQLQDEIGADIQAAARAVADYQRPDYAEPGTEYTLPEWAAAVGPLLAAVNRWRDELAPAQRLAHRVIEAAARESSKAHVSWKETMNPASTLVPRRGAMN